MIEETGLKTSIFTNNELVSLTKLEYDKFNNRISHKSYDKDGNIIFRWEYKNRDRWVILHQE